MNVVLIASNILMLKRQLPQIKKLFFCHFEVTFYNFKKKMKYFIVIEDVLMTKIMIVYSCFVIKFTFHRIENVMNCNVNHNKNFMKIYSFKFTVSQIIYKLVYTNILKFQRIYTFFLFEGPFSFLPDNWLFMTQIFRLTIFYLKSII